MLRSGRELTPFTSLPWSAAFAALALMLLSVVPTALAPLALSSVTWENELGRRARE